MADLILVSIMIAFIALCVAYVGWCDRIIGADDPATARGATPDTSPLAGVHAPVAESAVTA
jgi:hypothetical protein